MMAADGGFFYFAVVFGGNVEKCKVLKKTGWNVLAYCSHLCGSLRKSLCSLRYSLRQES
jgi:hypothetical protein